MHAKERQPRALTAIAMGLSNLLKCFQIDLLLDPVWGHSITKYVDKKRGEGGQEKVHAWSQDKG